MSPSRSPVISVSFAVSALAEVVADLVGQCQRWQQRFQWAARPVPSSHRLAIERSPAPGPVCRLDQLQNLARPVVSLSTILAVTTGETACRGASSPINSCWNSCDSCGVESTGRQEISPASRCSARSSRTSHALPISVSNCCTRFAAAAFTNAGCPVASWEFRAMQRVACSTPGAANTRTTHSPRKSNQQYLHGSGAPRGDGVDVCGLSRSEWTKVNRGRHPSNDLSASWGTQRTGLGGASGPFFDRSGSGSLAIEPITSSSARLPTASTFAKSTIMPSASRSTKPCRTFQPPYRIRSPIRPAVQRRAGRSHRQRN